MLIFVGFLMAIVGGAYLTQEQDPTFWWLALIMLIGGTLIVLVSFLVMMFKRYVLGES